MAGGRGESGQDRLAGRFPGLTWGDPQPRPIPKNQLRPSVGRLSGQGSGR